MAAHLTDHVLPPLPVRQWVLARQSADAQLGAVSFLHRFGSALNPHFHFHVVVLDGVFSEEPDRTVTFHEATHLSADDALRLQHALQRRGLLDDHTAVARRCQRIHLPPRAEYGVWTSYP